MGKLHDRLEEIGYEGHPLEVYLVRILFCLFAEDTTIFEKQQLQDYIEHRTAEDGSDLASKLQELFQVLNTAKDKRFKNLDEQLNDFPYVNGKLFEEILPMASFDSKMRQALLDCCYVDWSKISPAIFGSMFQSVMNPKERRNLGAHYTSESNILKLIKPLFLDELWEEFKKCKHDPTALTRFHNKIANLNFLDPACGCGNFLIITYRELRKLEFEVILTLQKLNRRIHQMEFLDISLFFKVNVDQFHGIEYEEFPSRIAEVAMWLIDHQMNMFASIETGDRLFRIPLTKSANIFHGDALEVNWQSLLNPINPVEIIAEHTNIYIVEEPKKEYKTANIQTKTYQIHKTKKPESNFQRKFDYIIGNPPFIGSKIMSQFQRNQIIREFENSKGCGVLDYVSGWYLKAAKYIQNSTTKAAFVSTNSVVQGEQTAILWGQMVTKYGVKIHFAHKTFKWSNEAKGNAAVYCIIVGFANFDTKNKVLFEYENIKGEPQAIQVKNINPYLVDAKDIFIEKRRKPICNIPDIAFGSMPNDGGNFFISENEIEEIKLKEPKSFEYIKPFIGAQEFLNAQKKYCYWFENVNPNDWNSMPTALQKVKAVEKHRESSSREATRKLANYPSMFGEIRQPKSYYILIPRVSSENRKIIPMGFFDKDSIIGDTCLSIVNATLFHFGILQSTMHMAWVKTTCGRLKSDFRYSNEIVYNNFPWPENPSDKHIKNIEEKAQKVLDARSEISNCPLGKMYDIGKMPPVLVKAHNELDKAVEIAYSKQVFTSEAKRMEFLFELYEKYIAGLFIKEKIKK